MDKATLIKHIQQRKSFLCVGLDTDITKIPKHLLSSEDPIFEFNKAIIDATRDLCVAYKPNLAFYEAYGLKGWAAFEKTVRYIGNEHFIIADAKRGDIGNTATMYAKAFFEQMPCDSITVAPYMGADSVRPFLEFEGKWAIVLGLTSNAGSGDFQLALQDGSMPLYEKVMRRVMDWGTPENTMFVIGATHPEKFAEIREIAPEHFFLVPGVGAQGGELSQIAKYGMNDEVGLLVNSSRGIIYADTGRYFHEKVHEEARKLQKEMERFIKL